jgi:hypothetical protein
MLTNLQQTTGFFPALLEILTIPSLAQLAQIRLQEQRAVFYPLSLLWVMCTEWYLPGYMLFI